MLGVAGYDIAILFGEGDLIKDTIVYVWKGFATF